MTTTSDELRLMPTLLRFAITLEFGKLVKEIPENSSFFFAVNLSALCRVWTSAVAAFLVLRRSSLMGAAVCASLIIPGDVGEAGGAATVVVLVAFAVFKEALVEAAVSIVSPATSKGVGTVADVEVDTNGCVEALQFAVGEERSPRASPRRKLLCRPPTPQRWAWSGQRVWSAVAGYRVCPLQRGPAQGQSGRQWRPQASV